MSSGVEGAPVVAPVVAEDRPAAGNALAGLPMCLLPLPPVGRRAGEARGVARLVALLLPMSATALLRGEEGAAAPAEDIRGDRCGGGGGGVGGMTRVFIATSRRTLRPLAGSLTDVTCPASIYHTSSSVGRTSHSHLQKATTEYDQPSL